MAYFGIKKGISTFRAVNTPESGAFKARNNAQTTSEHLQNNFQKPRKSKNYKYYQNPKK